jgi:hypothetical protein
MSQKVDINGFWYNLLMVTTIKSWAFPRIVDLIYVPMVAWKVEYRGAILIFHDPDRLVEYLNHKPTSVQFLDGRLIQPSI